MDLLVVPQACLLQRAEGGREARDKSIYVGATRVYKINIIEPSRQPKPIFETAQR